MATVPEAPTTTLKLVGDPEQTVLGVAVAVAVTPVFGLITVTFMVEVVEQPVLDSVPVTVYANGDPAAKGVTVVGVTKLPEVEVGMPLLLAGEAVQVNTYVFVEPV